MTTLYDLYKEDPVKALDEAFRRSAERCPWEKDRCFMWTSSQARDGVRYGGYKTVTREELADRRYTIEFWDGMVSIFFTDVWFIPQGSRGIYEPREI